MRDEIREVEERGETSRHDNSSETRAGQGRYVVPFTMTREEEAVGMEMGRSQLKKLMEECALTDSNTEIPVSSLNWTRVKSKKTELLLWEKRSVKPEVNKKKLGSFACSATEFDPNEDIPPATYSVRTSTTVNASMDTVLKTLDASVATAYRSFTRIIYGNLIADTSVLFHSSTVENTNDSFETFAVRWLVCRCSNPLISDCDFCLQEYTKRHSIDELSANGSHNNNNNEERSFGTSRDGLHAVNELPVAYKVFQSMETRNCPELLESHRVIRTKVPLGGFLLYSTENSEKTDVVWYMSIAQNICGQNGSFRTQYSNRQFRAVQNVVRQMALQIHRLKNAVDSYRMSLHLESLRTLQWVHNAERAECVVCYRKFHQLTRRRHHCRLCGEVICRECSVQKNVDLPTFGATLLRICVSCNRVHSLEAKIEPQVASSPQKRRIPVGKQENEAAVVENLLRQRSSTMESDNVKPSANEQKLATTHRRTASDQAASCSKPVTSPVIERIYFANQWAGTKVMSKLKSSAQNSAKTANPAATELLRDTFAFSPKLHTPFPTSSSSQSEEEDTFEPQSDSLNLSPKHQWRYSTRAVYAVQNGILDSANTQKFSATSNLVPKIQQDRPLVYRETLQIYEDILLKLCANAASVRNSQFVALTLFSRTSLIGKNQQENDETAISYLKVKGSAKLLHVAANLRCCEPVLELRKAIITRNTWTLEEKTRIHPSGFDFRQLPIVLGPQQARFYAGVPLTDATKRHRYGAIAVFDSALNFGADDDLQMKKTLQALQICANEAVKEVELRTFLQAPLVQLRQSEPAMHLRMEIESLDGESDDERDEAQRRLEVSNSKSDTHRINTKNSKSRVQYFHRKMQDLVHQAQDTQAQMVENSRVMERHGVPIV